MNALDINLHVMFENDIHLKSQPQPLGDNELIYKPCIDNSEKWRR